MREVGRADRRQAIVDQAIFELPEARRGRPAESQRRRHRRFRDRNDAVVAGRAHVDFGIDVEAAPIEHAIVELVRGERHFVFGLRGQAAGDRDRVFHALRQPRVVRRTFRLDRQRVVPLEPCPRRLRDFGAIADIDVQGRIRGERCRSAASQCARETPRIQRATSH